MLPIRLTIQAELDILGITDRVAEAYGGAAAEKYISELLESITTLSRFPNAGSKRPRYGAGIRIWHHHPRTVCYRVTPEQVEIMRILYGRRRIARKLIQGDNE